MFKKSLAIALTVALAATTAQADEPKLPVPTIAEELTIPRQEITVLDSTMSYLEIGQGAPVLFLHGNPTSAYLWRNVMPHLADTHRAIAVDLIGMGHSGKPAIDYSFADHARYLDAFIEAMDLGEFTIVGHDWGAALGWNFARRHPDRVVRLAFMEGAVPPAFPQPSYEAMGEEMGGLFRAMQDPVQGYEMIVKGNMFVEGILPQLVVRPLGETARAEYGVPYQTLESRQPVWSWPLEVPIGGKPAHNVNMMNEIAAFMQTTDMPVLLAYAEPGIITPPQAVPAFTSMIDNLETAFIGQGLHYVQEDQPDAIGRALDDWLRRN